MKANIHPKWHKDAKVIVNGETVMTIGSTQPELHIEIWAGTHPFFTGKQKFIDTASRIEKFEKRKSAAQPRKKKQEKVQESTQDQGPQTLKDMLQALKKQ